MKKLIYILLAAAATFTACKKDESAKINDVTVQVLIGDEPVTDAVEVTVTDKSTSTAYKATTVGGTATFRLVAGIYGQNIRKPRNLSPVHCNIFSNLDRHQGFIVNLYFIQIQTCPVCNFLICLSNPPMECINLLIDLLYLTTID